MILVHIKTKPSKYTNKVKKMFPDLYKENNKSAKTKPSKYTNQMKKKFPDLYIKKNRRFR